MPITQKGFVATRTLHGAEPVLKTFRVDAADAHRYFPGDPVQLKSNGRVIPLSAAATNVLGVVQAVYGVDDNGKPKPLTFNQPSRGAFLASAEEGYVEVNVDPMQLYEVAIDVTASIGLIGNSVLVSAGSPDANVQRSGFSLNGASIATTTDTSQFMITGLSDPDLLDGNLTIDVSTPAGVEVKILRSTFGGVNGIPV